MLKPLPPWPALLFEDGGERAVIIADLHMGFEHELAEFGINIPSQTQKLCARILSLAKEYKPVKLIIAGDVKHSVPKISLHEWRDVPNLFEEVVKAIKSIEVIPGNHDGELEPLLPRNVRICDARGLRLGKSGDVGVFHGHAWPSPDIFEARHLVIGHNHPAVQFRDSLGFRTIMQSWIKIPLVKERLAEEYLKFCGIKFEGPPLSAFKESLGVNFRASSLIILPAFNDVLGGLPVNFISPEEMLGPIFKVGCVNLDEAEAYLLDGTFLGAIKQLRSFA